jgi:hypothetical protein
LTFLVADRNWATMKRRFENGDRFLQIRLGKTDSEWLCWIDFGDGRRQQSQTRSFEEETEQLAYRDTQIARVLKGGYTEVAVAQPVPEPEPDPALARGAYRFERARRFEKDKTEIQVEQLEQVIRVTGKPDDACGALASTRYERLCTQLEERGYYETMPVVEVRANEALERDPQGRATYIDWLITERDARGEIAARHVAGKIADIPEVIERWYPDFPPETYRFQFRDGFIVGAVILAPEEHKVPLWGLVGRFLGSPLARFVEDLELGPDWFNRSWIYAVDKLAASPVASRLRRLVLRADNAWFDRDEPTDHLRGGDWHELSALEELQIHGRLSGRIGDLELPVLRTLSLSSFHFITLQQLAEAKLPKLERMELTFGRRPIARDVGRDLADLFAGSKSKPALRHLALRECSGFEVAPLAKSKLLAKLESLALTDGSLSPEAVEALIRNAPKFRHLGKLDLERNDLDDDLLRALRKAFPKAVVASQGMAPAPYDEAPHYDEVGE